MFEDSHFDNIKNMNSDLKVKARISEVASVSTVFKYKGFFRAARLATDFFFASESTIMGEIYCMYVWFAL